MKKLVSSALCLLLVMALVLPTFGVAVVKVTGIKLDTTSVSLSVGDTKTLQVTFTPANTTQKNLVFSTSNKNVASVNTDGTIVTAGAGSAVITVKSASNDALTATCKVTVKTKAPVTLNVEVFDRTNAGGSAPDNNVWTKWIQENLNKKYPNIKLKFVTCVRSQEQNKLNIWMASNQAPDICYTYDVNTIYNYYKNGGLTKLDTALNAYGTELKEFLGNDVLIRGKYYGEQWSIPAKRIMNAQSTQWIRKDWLDKLNMPMPTTTTEFYNAMKAFKDKNPGQVGKVVPLAVTYDVGYLNKQLLESFMTDTTAYARYLAGDVLRFIAPGYKDGVKLLNKMYNEGLISSEFALDRDGLLMRGDISKGYVGSQGGEYDTPIRSGTPETFLPNMVKKIAGYNMIPVDCFKSVSTGVTTKQVYDQAGLRIIVPKTSEKKVNEAIQYLNWLSDKDVLFYLQYGEEGVNHTMKDGLPIYTAVTGEKIMNSGNNIDYTLIVNGVNAGDMDKTLKLSSLAYGSAADVYISSYKIAVTNGYIAPVLTIPSDADAKYSNTLKEKGYEFYAKALTCKPEEFEATYNKMLDQLMKAGGNEVLAERKAAWKKEKGTSKE